MPLTIKLESKEIVTRRMLDTPFPVEHIFDLIFSKVVIQAFRYRMYMWRNRMTTYGYVNFNYHMMIYNSCTCCKGFV